MRARVLAIALFAVMASVDLAAARDRCADAACAAVKADIRDVERRLRAGYTRAQGERLNARLRKLRARRAKLCR